MQRTLLIVATLLVCFTGAAVAQSCTEQLSKCISNAPTLGWTAAESARNCNNKRMKCLQTGCWFINRQGTNRCGLAKQ